jgi:hypothetical protein
MPRALACNILFISFGPFSPRKLNPRIESRTRGTIVSGE